MPEELLHFLLGLLYREQLEEVEQLPLDKHEEWRVLCIDLPGGPIEEHQGDAVEAEAQALAHCHERVSHYGSVGEPDPVVDYRDNGKRKVNATNIFGVDHVLYVHHRNHVEADARQGAESSTHRNW